MSATTRGVVSSALRLRFAVAKASCNNSQKASSLLLTGGRFGKTASLATVSSLGIDKATGITKPVSFGWNHHHACTTIAMSSIVEAANPCRSMNLFTGKSSFTAQTSTRGDSRCVCAVGRSCVLHLQETCYSYISTSLAGDMTQTLTPLCEGDHGPREELDSDLIGFLCAPACRLVRRKGQIEMLFLILWNSHGGNYWCLWLYLSDVVCPEDECMFYMKFDAARTVV